VSANGRRRPPRPRIALVSPAASESEATAVVAAVEQFLIDTAPTPRGGGAEAAASRWQRAALEEGIAARQLGGRAWGPGSG
jgi:hypothetical protein